MVGSFGGCGCSAEMKRRSSEVNIRQCGDHNWTFFRNGDSEPSICCLKIKYPMSTSGTA